MLNCCYKAYIFPVVCSKFPDFGTLSWKQLGNFVEMQKTWELKIIAFKVMKFEISKKDQELKNHGRVIIWLMLIFGILFVYGQKREKNIMEEWNMHNANSNELDCKSVEILLVSDLPKNIKEKFQNFVSTEESNYNSKISNKNAELPKEENHHVNRQNIGESENLRTWRHLNLSHSNLNAITSLDQTNPRIVVLNSQVQHLWKSYTDTMNSNNNFGNENDNFLIPTFDTEIYMSTVFTIAVSTITPLNLMNSSHLLPLIHAEVNWGIGLAGSYKLSFVESNLSNHTHADGNHRPVVDLDIQYKSCNLLNHAHVKVSVYVNSCPAINFSYKVKCHKIDFLQGMAIGFEVGNSFPVFPHILQGSYVSNGKTQEIFADIKGNLQQTIDKTSLYTDFYVWNSCTTASLWFKYPTVVADMSILSPDIKIEKRKNVFISSSNISSYLNVQPFNLFTADVISHSKVDVVKHFRLYYNCIEEGKSLVALEFAFHEYQNVQITLWKICEAKGANTLNPENECSMGIPDENKSVCCSATCEFCEETNCELRDGGTEGCCPSHIVDEEKFCTGAAPPCVMKNGLSMSDGELTFIVECTIAMLLIGICVLMFLLVAYSIKIYQKCFLHRVGTLLNFCPCVDICCRRLRPKQSYASFTTLNSYHRWKPIGNEQENTNMNEWQQMTVFAGDVTNFNYGSI